MAITFWAAPEIHRDGTVVQISVLIGRRTVIALYGFGQTVIGTWRRPFKNETFVSLVPFVLILR